LPPSPNPFGDKGVYIAYWLYTDAKINIHVYDVSGELVRDLPTYPGRSGNNETFWDGKNSAGHPVSSGVYIYEIVATTPRDEVAHAFSKVAARR
jgi:flagellar hook assembly protein FlgD